MAVQPRLQVRLLQNTLRTTNSDGSLRRQLQEEGAEPIATATAASVGATTGDFEAHQAAQTTTNAAASQCPPLVDVDATGKPTELPDPACSGHGTAKLRRAKLDQAAAQKLRDQGCALAVPADAANGEIHSKRVKL